MAKQKVMWECLCGNVVTNMKCPDECDECGKEGDFIQIPQEKSDDDLIAEEELI